jgi:hypothetical protein
MAMLLIAVGATAPSPSPGAPASKCRGSLFSGLSPFKPPVCCTIVDAPGSAAVIIGTPRKIWHRNNRQSGVRFVVTGSDCMRALVTESFPRPCRIEEQRAGVACMTIVPLLANSSFDPETVEVLSGAFDDAWLTIKRSDSTLARPAYERGAREILAKRIIELAQRGERDRRNLSDSAVQFLAQNYKQ